MPRLVVMMPVHNGEKTVGAAVASTLTAMPRDAQLVLWDDASVDKTRQLIDQMNDPRIRLIASDQVRGSGFARRAILEATDSEFVANMDADDLTFPWRFRLSHRALRHHDIVFSTALLFGCGQVPRLTWPAPLPTNSVRPVLALLNPLIHSTMTARRAVIDAAGSYSDLKMAQDYDLWLRAVTNGASIAKIATPLAAYRRSAGQVSRTTQYAIQLRRQPALRQDYIRFLIEVLDMPVSSSGMALVDRNTFMQLLREQLAGVDPVSRFFYGRSLRRSEQLMFQALYEMDSSGHAGNDQR